ncbi:hypothetical protein ACIBAG_42600 [Streptomyces sp. NPDC051243]|uniref:hypothetical protein n=1 Tax=Streptomyces sp. NPDC051243 TaxID=3365646 RepID=UPI0037B89CA9
MPEHEVGVQNFGLRLFPQDLEVQPVPRKRREVGRPALTGLGFVKRLLYFGRWGPGGWRGKAEASGRWTERHENIYLFMPAEKWAFLLSAQVGLTKDDEVVHARVPQVVNSIENRTVCNCRSYAVCGPRDKNLLADILDF